MTYASVEDWLGEIENYSSRAERMTLNECHYARTAWQLATERCEAEISELKRERAGYQKHLHECEQIAGKALGYPWYKDDQKNFPGATEADGVCVGEHVGDTIVAELAKRYEDAKEKIVALEETIQIMLGDMRIVIKAAERDAALLKTESMSL